MRCGTEAAGPVGRIMAPRGSPAAVTPPRVPPQAEQRGGFGQGVKHAGISCVPA